MEKHKYLPNGILFDDDVNDTDQFISNGFRSRIPRPVPKETSTNEKTQQNQLYLQKKQEIETNMLQTTERSINILLDTEDFGIQIARELSNQGEKLHKTNEKLDEIDSHLSKSQKDINGIKSVFHGIKNIITGKSRSLSPKHHTFPRKKSSKSKSKFYETDHPLPSTVKLAVFNSPSAKTYDIQSPANLPNSKVDEMLRANLDTMSSHISNLKILGEEFGKEIDNQSQLIDILQDKAEHVDIKIGKQNKEMNKILE